MWQIKVATFGTEEVTKLLEDGWEPFAISASAHVAESWLIWLRKELSAKDIFKEVKCP